MIINNCADRKTELVFGNRYKPAKSVVSSLVSDSNVLNYLDALALSAKSQIKPVKPYDIPIKDEEEFNQVMERVLKAKTQNGNTLWITREDWETYYPEANNIERGLLPYCGAFDSSYLINMFLSGRLKSPKIQKNWNGLLPAKESDCIDMVRVLDYSLAHLDNEFGKYGGIVYRQGYMAKDCGQFFSASKSPSIAGKLDGSWISFEPERGFSVIRTKSGHNIYEFQKKMKNDFAHTEEEILLSRKGKYIEVTPENMDDELLVARDKMAGNLFKGAREIVLGRTEGIQGFTREDLRGIVRVFDEV